MRPLLAALCLLLAHLTYVVADYECGHIPPQRVGYSAAASFRTRGEATERKPIRIVPWYYEEDFNKLTPALRSKYKSIAVRAIRFLSSFLKVEPLAENITIQRYCNLSDRHLPESLSALNYNDYCTPKEPCQTTFCAFPQFPVPEKHLKACKTCETNSSANCSTVGKDGPGVADADVVIYVAAREFQCGTSSLAYATHCFQDKRTDRPIAGVINLCPRLATEEDIDNILLAVTHELTHAMVFSAHLMPFYRDKNGNPRTPRDNTTGLPTTLGFNKIFLFQPSNNTVLEETVKREALHGVYDINTTRVVTPAVLREARHHFDCPTLNGLELENLGAIGTAYNHWKKRLVENEAMTGVISTNGVFSRLTFALYEDSGWYDVDYSVASPLRWGQCLGCDFAEKSCFSYGLTKEPFCSKEEYTPLLAIGANTSCTYDRVAVAFCDLVNVSRAHLTIPIQYQYYPDPNFGGSEATNDYCPVHMAHSHCQRQRDLGDNAFLQSVGPSSMCVNFEIRTSWMFNGTTISPIHGGGCYEVSCGYEGFVLISVGQTLILCQSAGQEVIVQANGFNIVIICPAFEDICWENSTTCPATSPSSGLSQVAIIAIAASLGSVSLLAIIVIAALVVVAVIYKVRRRKGGNSSRHGRRNVHLKEAEKLIGENLVKEEANEDED